MEVTLEVRERIVRRIPYYRLNIPKQLSKQLNLKKGYRLRLKILKIIEGDSSEKEEPV